MDAKWNKCAKSARTKWRKRNNDDTLTCVDRFHRDLGDSELNDRRPWKDAMAEQWELKEFTLQDAEDFDRICEEADAPSKIWRKDLRDHTTSSWTHTRTTHMNWIAKRNAKTIALKIKGKRRCLGHARVSILTSLSRIGQISKRSTFRIENLMQMYDRGYQTPPPTH